MLVLLLMVQIMIMLIYNIYIKNTNGRRKGTISVYIDATGNTSILDDKFITSVDPTSTDLDNVSGVVASGVFNLQYTATDASNVPT